MTEKIYIKQVIGRGDEATLLSHAILNSVTNDVLGSIRGKAGKKPEDDKRWIDVELKMNGFPVKLSAFMEHLDSEIDRMIKGEAKNIVLEALADTTDTLSDIMAQAGDVIKDIVRKRLSVTISDDWD